MFLPDFMKIGCGRIVRCLLYPPHGDLKARSCNPSIFQYTNYILLLYIYFKEFTFVVDGHLIWIFNSKTEAKQPIKQLLGLKENWD
jgi:hypothetical protein